jgi:hypothetical protein
MPHRALRSFVLVLLAALAMPLGAQTPPPATNANDPFAVLAAKEPQEPTAGGVRVVVLKPDRSPATDAVVVFTPWRDEEAERVRREAASQRFPGDEPKRFAMLAADGTRLRVDERGATRVPKHGYVFAFAGELAARRFLSERFAEPRCELRLMAPRTIPVEVTTADGAPAAGVPIALRDGPKHISTRVHTTSTDGTAELRLLTARPATAMVLLDIAAKTTVQAPLPANGERVRLQLPKTTAVEATFAGDLVPGSQLKFGLRCGDATNDVPGERTGERSARWPFVEVDAPIAITVQDSGLELAVAAATAKPGGEPLALVRQQTQATFAVQLLDAEGIPARRHLVELSWKGRNSSIDTSAATNAEGWLELAMPSGFVGKGDVALHLQMSEPGNGPLRGLATLTLQAKVKVRTELPPLRCDAPPLLASGTVVTRDGSPLPKFDLDVSTPSYRRIATDAEGRFVVRGAEDQQALHIHLPRGWCFVDGDPWSRQLPIGTKGERFVVQRAARIRFDAGLKQGALSMIGYRLEPASGQGPKVALELARRLSEPEFLAPPGHWHFVAHLHGEELLRLPDLRCDSGVETHDPRFMAFDWRAYAILVALTVRDGAGQPTDDCTVWLRHRGSGMGSSPTNGVAHLLLPKAGGSVDIAPNDKKIAKIDLGVVTEDQVVVLGGGPPLTVTLSPMPQLPEGVEIVLAVGDSDAVAFDGKGSALLVLPAVGSYTPRISLRKGNTTMGPMQWSLPALDVPKEGKKLAVEVTAGRQQEIESLLALLRG